MHTSRRSFSAVALGWAGLAALGLLDAASGTASGAAIARGEDDVAGWPGFPRQSHDLARATVGASHGNFEKVQELVSAHPALANAAWDWGFGDWETAIGAAAHTGQREIAEYLIASGARIDIFAAAMLGYLDVVRTLVEAYEGLQRTKGPHGIPMLAHATAGGEKAAAVAEYLTKLGDAGVTYAESKFTAEQMEAYLGVYSYGNDPGQRFSILSKRDQLAFQKGEDAFRFLFKIATREFHPAGAPGVRLTFELKPDREPGLVITDHDLQVAATRVSRP